MGTTDPYRTYGSDRQLTQPWQTGGSGDVRGGGYNWDNFKSDFDTIAGYAGDIFDVFDNRSNQRDFANAQSEANRANEERYQEMKDLLKGDQARLYEAYGSLADEQMMSMQQAQNMWGQLMGTARGQLDYTQGFLEDRIGTSMGMVEEAFAGRERDVYDASKVARAEAEQSMQQRGLGSISSGIASQVFAARERELSRLRNEEAAARVDTYGRTSADLADFMMKRTGLEADLGRLEQAVTSDMYQRVIDTMEKGELAHSGRTTDLVNVIENRTDMFNQQLVAQLQSSAGGGGGGGLGGLLEVAGGVVGIASAFGL